LRTRVTKGSEIRQEWRLVDAEGMVLGRLSAEVARILRGKHKANYSSHLDNGDHVVIVNAEKIVITGRKLDHKRRYIFSGYPSGLHSTTYREWLTTQPEELVRRSIRGMLPKTRLGRDMLRKVRIYAGPNHPHAGQNPEVLSWPHARHAVK
jgi:large subunit ribosomal protein L13